MARVEGLTRVVEALRKKAAAIKDTKARSVVVGYTAAYAIFVHENLEAVHPVGQAKFLEQPARMMQRELALYIVKALKAGKPVMQVLLEAGLKLQAASQRLCPVDTGALRASAFTRIE